jgi:putative effector of murein hydrolase LrgA (UPF0299 family)
VSSTPKAEAGSILSILFAPAHHIIMLKANLYNTHVLAITSQNTVKTGKILFCNASIVNHLANKPSKVHDLEL